MDQGRRFDKGDVILGKLEVIRVLGEGGMGVVYEVEHKITKHRRALKLLHPHISQNSDVTARLLREASVAGRLRTKHVVETFDAGQLDDGAAYVLMEMLEGKSLAEVLEDGRLPAGRIASLIWEACEGLAVAHRGGIVHRDIKPDNMFVATDLDGEEIVKILDFGISKFSERHDYQGTLTADGAVMGTPFYMSPEQTRGLKEIDGRTDIYAMGVILYEAIAGEVPFNAETFPMLVVAIHEGSYTPLDERVPDVDPGLAAVVHKAMSKERDARYASARDLQEALRPYADRELPERMGHDSALALEHTMAADSSPPRLSKTATPMAVDDRAVSPEEPTRSKWPLFAGVGLAVFGLLGLSIALVGGGDGGEADTPVEDEQVRGIEAGDEGPSTGAASQISDLVDAAAAAVPDASAADAEAADGGPDTGALPEGLSAPMTPDRGRMGMRAMTRMSTTRTMDGIHVDDDVYSDP